MRCLVRIGYPGHWRACWLPASRTMKVDGVVIPVCSTHRTSKRLHVYGGEA